MKKYIIILLSLVLLLTMLTGCSNNNKIVDPREKEIVQLVVHDKFDEALVRAKELYRDNKNELEETIEWINKSKANNQKNKEIIQKQIQDLYPSKKLEIQSGYTYKTKGDYIYINGKVKNISDKDISYFEVSVDFMDNEGNILDSDYTNDGLLLKSGAMREFEIMHHWSSDYEKYKLSIEEVR